MTTTDQLTQLLVDQTPDAFHQYVQVSQMDAAGNIGLCVGMLSFLLWSTKRVRASELDGDFKPLVYLIFALMALFCVILDICNIVDLIELSVAPRGFLVSSLVRGLHN